MPLTQVVAGNRILASDLNAFYNLLKGVAASGESVTLIYNNTALIFQPSSDPAAGTRVLDIKNNAGTHLMSLDYNGVLELLAAAAAPSGAVAGALYWDTVLAALRVYDGANWRNTAELPMSITALWQWSFIPGMTIQSTVTGTGSYAVTAGYADGLLQTGATSASTTGLKQTFTFGVGTGGMNKLRYWSFALYLNQVDAATDYRHFLTEGDVTTQPSLTVRHVGVRATTSSTVLFSTADGTTEQTTDISTWAIAAAEHHIVTTFDGTTARCYINGTLRATHTTNVPTANAGAWPVFVSYLTNSAAVNKQVHVGTMVVQMAA